MFLTKAKCGHFICLDTNMFVFAIVGSFGTKYFLHYVSSEAVCKGMIGKMHRVSDSVKR